MRGLPILAAFVAALAAAGCGNSSKTSEPAPPPPPPPATTPTPTPPPAPPTSVASKPPRIYTKAELPRLALQPKDGPRHLRYVPEESGPLSLADIYLLPRELKEAKVYGVRSAYDAVFEARSARSDTRVGQRVWLLSSPAGARRWLEKSKQSALGLDFESVSAPKLGDGSWAARGLIQFGGRQAVTHAFRLGNAVFVVSMHSEVTPVSDAAALAAARAALARAKKV